MRCWAASVVMRLQRLVEDCQARAPRIPRHHHGGGRPIPGTDGVDTITRVVPETIVERFIVSRLLHGCRLGRRDGMNRRHHWHQRTYHLAIPFGRNLAPGGAAREPSLTGKRWPATLCSGVGQGSNHTVRRMFSKGRRAATADARSPPLKPHGAWRVNEWRVCVTTGRRTRDRGGQHATMISLSIFEPGNIPSA